MPLTDDELKGLGRFSGKALESAEPSKQVDPAVDKDPALQKYMAPNAQMLGDQVGVVPHLALPESPLSALERGAFGWIKDPKAQTKYLEEKFGHGNVQVAKMDDDNSGFIVKSQDGKWRQVDPAGLSDIPNDLMKLNVGQAYNRIKNFNLKNTIGGAAQFAGEHGFDSGGAVAAAPLGVAAGAPFGPIGMAVGGTVAGALGGGAGALAEAGVRKGLSYVQDATGTEIPGARGATPEELGHQVMGSMLFGGMQELAAPFLKAGPKAAAKIFGTLLEKLGDTPASKQAQASLIKGMSGLKDGLARAWADDPQGVAQYIPTALKDKENNTDALISSQKTAINGFFDSAQGALRGLGRQYDAIEKKVGDKVFNALAPDHNGTSPIADAFQKLHEERYVDSKGDLLTPGTNEISRDVGGTNGVALRKVTDDFKTLLAKNGEASYKDLRIMERNIENNLFGQNQVTDGTLRNIFGQLRSAINTVQSKGLHEVDPELSGQMAALNAKYGPAKELLGTLGQKSQDQRLDAFLKQVIRDDGSYNAEMMNSVGNLLGLDNPTKDILHMEVAKQSAPWWMGSGSVNLMGVKLPASPGLTRQVVDNVISPMQQLQSGVSDSITPVMNKVHSVYKSLPDEMKNTFVKSPDAIKQLGNLMTGSIISEQTDKSKILKDSGAFQQSQFGQ